MSNCPCKDCNDRVVGCHDRCESFCNWKKSETEKKDKIYESKQLSRLLDDMHRKSASTKSSLPALRKKKK